MNWKEAEASLREQMAKAGVASGAPRQRVDWLVQQRLVEFVDRWKGFYDHLGENPGGDLILIVEVTASMITTELDRADPGSSLIESWATFLDELGSVAKNESTSEDLSAAAEKVLEEVRAAAWEGNRA